MNKIDFFAKEFNQKAWEKYSSCFKDYSNESNEFSVIPKDILNVIVGLLGAESGKD